MSPEHVLENIWEALREATTQRTEFTRAALATVTTAGQPRVRSVILREFATHPERIGFATDVRSAKIAEIHANPQVALAFYDAMTDTQLRIEGTAVVVTDHDQRQRAWQHLTLHSKQLYADPAIPGTPLEADETSDERTAFERFAWVSIDIASRDWLELSAEPLRRWHFQRHNATWTGHGLVP